MIKYFDFEKDIEKIDNLYNLKKDNDPKNSKKINELNNEKKQLFKKFIFES